MADLRLADLIATLSQVTDLAAATDLGMAQPPEAAVRSCLLATGLARRMNIDERDVSDIYYTTLLWHAGCTAYAHETASLLGGDDIAIRAGGATVDFTSRREALRFFLLELDKDARPLERARTVYAAVRMGPSFNTAMARSNCEAAVHIADRLDMGTPVRRGLGQIYERWDGKGNPHKLARDDIALPARFAHLANQAEIFHRLGGADLAIETTRDRSAAGLDPSITDAFLRHGRELLAEIDAADAMVAVIDAEPRPHHYVPDAHLDEVARAFADMVDLKSPFTHGHSTGVSRLASEAARACGLPEAEVVNIRRAGLLHDLGRVGIPNGILDKAGLLTSSEWERVRLHPYHSERILSRSPVLEALASLVGMHHERLDGSGYYRQCPATMIPLSARVLAAANMYQAMTQQRPYRPAHSPDSAATLLIAEAEQGRLAPEAAEAVLRVTGHTGVRPKHTRPHGLTDREVEVLRLLAHGESTREIGEALFISAKTADHHVQHIYTKIGVSTRAGAAMFAMQRDLVQTHPA